MESLEKPNAGKDAEKDKAVTKAKGRHRSKHKFNSIRKQIEFYFSDANLTKDRYMGQLLRNGPFIPLEEFLKFNKIKALTTNVDEIANALKNSTLLELSDDRAKVRRKTEVVVKANSEECTIYVESLPPKADHDWVRNVFSSYGTVAYVSLPKFRNSGKIKEFGFVEFDEEASVQKALKAFQTFGGVLAYDTTDPAKMASIKTYEPEKGTQQHGEGSGETKAEQGAEMEKPIESSTGSMAEDDGNKREEDGDEPPAKRHKIDPTSDEDDDTQDDQQSDREANGQKQVEPASEEEFQSDQEEPVGEQDNKDGTDQTKGDGQDVKQDTGKKKCRQRKGCSIIKKELQLDDKVYELKIMTKKEWRRLRNKYLNLQKEEAKKLKRLFHQTDKHPHHHHHHQRGGHPKTIASHPSGGIAIKSIKSSPRVNFYGAMPVEEDEEHGEQDGTGSHLLQPEAAEESAATAKRPLFSFEPGLIVSIKFREPCVDVKDFRAELKQYPYVKYIDLKEGDFEAFVRVDTPASAVALVKEYCSAEHSAQILSGEQEQQYWDKMMRDREDKLNKRVKTERIRGRTKLIRKINSHIKFDDDDE
ncbi:la-related protein 7 [Anopheles gambiae]|uniref:la-related protein 7 n=1 Tax=Anopheles gambiae TaxID=7165 RepID=UPI002AC95DD3|nr:la-related protein 7 [Anopheles gambiae]